MPEALRSVKGLLGIIGILLLLSIAPGASAQSSLPEGPGQKLVELVCSKCHTTERIARKRITKSEWREEVTEMLQEEDDVTEAEKDEIVEYLAKTFPAKADFARTAVPSSCHRRLLADFRPLPVR